VSSIDRVRYYDGEFLRAFDFNDEQTYHTEMRRRLNRNLHLVGIVQGLNLVANTSAGVTQVSIMPGLAIDGFGREIYVFAPYTLGDSDITANRISIAGNYDVWLRYQKTPSTPPSSGYSACDQANQYTRWVESYSVVLLPSPSGPFPDPVFKDDDTDDPTQDQVSVLLGVVFVDPTSATSTFSNPLFDPTRCVLLGVIAQRIQTPYDATQATPPFNFWNQNVPVIPNTPLSPPSSLEIEPNVFMDQNLIVGPDFVLSSTPTTNISITPSPVTTPGSVKVAGDLFVQGNIYSPTVPSPGTQKWSGMSVSVPQLLQSAMPDFIASQPIQVAVPAAAPAATSFSTTTPPIVLTSTKLGAMTNAVVSAAISGIQLNAPVSFASPVGVFITNVASSPANPAANQCTIVVTYTVTGDFVAGAKPSILSFNLTATAVCFP
jgi:hypothetical protein